MKFNNSYNTLYNKSKGTDLRIAINRTLDAIARGQDRILLVMATGDGGIIVTSQAKTAYLCC